MEKIDLTCIGCPMGCQITVTKENGEIADVTGYTCKRGLEYAKKEVTNPTRIVTSSVPVTGSRRLRMVSCKTREDIPKGKIADVLFAMHQTTVQLPVRIGDVIVGDVAGTGVDLVATANM